MGEAQVGQHHGFISIPSNILVLFHGSVLYSYEEKETMASALPKANIFYAFMPPHEARVSVCVENHNTLNFSQFLLGL